MRPNKALAIMVFLTDKGEHIHASQNLKKSVKKTDANVPQIQFPVTDFVFLSESCSACTPIFCFENTKSQDMYLQFLFYKKTDPKNPTCHQKQVKTISKLTFTHYKQIKTSFDVVSNFFMTLTMG